jgi:DNA-binding beta-propeller fold protein YncE
MTQTNALTSSSNVIRSTSLHVALVLLAGLHPLSLAGQATAACYATHTSMTPGSWRQPANVLRPKAAPGLRLLREIPLPGPANRFDYQSVDALSGRIYINHMNAGRTIIFDADAGKVVAEVAGVPRATGVWAVPSHHQVYVSAAGNHEVVSFDDRTFKVTARIGGIKFPDGIAYAPGVDKVFISDESGGADVVIDPNVGRKRSTIDLGGEAGNTHYDSVSRCILVAVQTRNQLVAIDPVSERIVQRFDLPDSDGPHGFVLDEPERLAFISSEGNGKLQVLDLRSMTILQTLSVPDDPDVLAWDPGWRRLYVASESGVVSAYVLDGKMLKPLGEIRAAHAHTVSVDPRTHLVYVPLENQNGRPVLRIYQPSIER